MKLILSSCDFLNENSRKRITQNIKKPLDKNKVLFIPSVPYQINNLAKYYKRLELDGFKKENVYIFNEYEVNKFTDLDIDLIYIGGGNTFATLKKIKETKFDKYIINYLNNKVIYIGGSCGAHIVSSNIEHVLNFDLNSVNLKDFTGLNLFNGIIIPHFDNSREIIYQDLIKENKYKIYTLTANATLIATDNKIKIYDNWEEL